MAWLASSVVAVPWLRTSHGRGPPPGGRKLVTTMLAFAAATGTLCTASRGEGAGLAFRAGECAGATRVEASRQSAATSLGHRSAPLDPTSDSPGDYRPGSVLRRWTSNHFTISAL